MSSNFWFFSRQQHQAIDAYWDAVVELIAGRANSTGNSRCGIGGDDPPAARARATAGAVARVRRAPPYGADRGNSRGRPSHTSAFPN